MSLPRVLVVDDSPTVCYQITTILEHAGFQVETAHSGQECVAKFLKRPPHCLLLDVLLPDMTGYTICRHIRQGLPAHTIPIIFISSKSTPLDQKYGLRQGAQRYLTKPFTPDALVQAVYAVIAENAQPPAVPKTPLKAQKPEFPPLLGLIPRHAPRRDAMRARGPLNPSFLIRDEHARQLYAAIDGRKTIGELARVTGMEVQAVVRALQMLHGEKHIQLYDAKGQSVENTF